MKKLSVLLIVLALLLAITPAVLADDGNGDITVTGNGYSIVIQDFNVPVTLTGGDQTLTYETFATDWVAKDMSGTGEGWHLLIKATDFTCQSGACSTAPTTPIDRTVLPLVYAHDQHASNQFSTLSFKMPDTDIDWVDGQWGVEDGGVNDYTPNSMGGFETEAYKSLTTSDQQFVSAALDEGMGTYNLDPDFQVWVPAELYAGVYRSIITVTIASGPTAP
jgi:hypothetical protein